MHIKTTKVKSVIIKSALLSVFIIAFFVAIILAYYNMLIMEKRDSIIRDGEISVKKVETEITRFIDASSDAIELTSYMIEEMMDDNRSSEEILDFLTSQTTVVMNAICDSTNGLYGLIDGKYLDGSGWIPDEDYVPTERPWYYKTIANNGEITIIEPYLDANTGSVVMSLAKTMKDGKSVVSLDILLDRIQLIIEETMSTGGSDLEVVLDDNDLVIAHADRNEVGNKFGEIQGSLDAAILEQLNRSNRDSFELNYNGYRYIVYQIRMQNGLRCLSVEDATVMFRPLRVLLAVTLAVVFLIVSVLAVIMHRLGKKTQVAEMLNTQLSSAVEIYHSVLDLDIRNDIIINIHTDDNRITEILNVNQGKAQQALYDILNRFSDPVSRGEILRFVDLSTLNERLKGRRAIMNEFLSVQDHWMRGRFVVSERTTDGEVSHVLWLVEDINEEKCQRDALLETVTKMNEQISSVANIYFSMYDVDLTNDTLLELRTNAQEVSETVDDHMENAQAVMNAMMDQTVHEQSRDVIHEFIKLSTLCDRMKNTNTITEEFLSSRDIWCRTRFVVSKRDIDGTIDHVLWLVEGIDEEKRRRDSLIDMSERAIAASEAKSSFLSNMSHEIRTPINAVLGMNEMILRESEDQNVLSYSESIRTAGNTLLGIVNDILDFSKIEAGKMEIIPVDYDLSSVLNDLVNMVQTRAEDKGLVLKMNFDREIPRLLHGDEVRIKQVITNILTNAIKYTEKGSVTFSVGFDRVSDDDIFLNISVRDTGIGIKPEDMAKLFSEFERIEEKRNRNIEGTGLGMNITKRLLEMMGSALKVESVYGEGSVFSFRIEQQVIGWEQLGDYEKSYRAALSTRKKSEAMFLAPDAVILVVDDTPMNLMVFKSLLKRTKVQIDTAASGDEGLAHSLNKKYDIIFLDHMMPEKDGIETLHELRQRENDPNLETPTICLTANAISGAREKYLAEGFDDYLTKPIDSVKLEEMLITYLPKEKIREAGGENADDDAKTTSEIPGILQPLQGQDWIDIPLGIRNSGDTEAYLPLLKIFYDSMEGTAEEIEGFYTEKDWKNYTIKVHALKSSARLIGAASFGEEAQLLENAGKSGDVGYILTNHSDFMAKYRSFRTPLAEVFDEKEQGEDKPEADAGLMESTLEKVRSAAEEMDCDLLEEIFAEMSAYRIPEAQTALWDQIIKAADRFDYDAITELL